MLKAGGVCMEENMVKKKKMKGIIELHYDFGRCSTLCIYTEEHFWYFGQISGIDGFNRGLYQL